MATASTAPAPKPTTKPLAASVSTPAKPAVEATKSAWDKVVVRPIRYTIGFVGGTFTHTLNDMAIGGRKGAWLGMGIGLVGALTGAFTGGLSLLVLGWAGGLLAGAVLGGSIGLVTGGIRGIDMEHRKNKYSDDLLVKAKAKSAPSGPEVDYRQAHRDYTRQTEAGLDRIFQTQRENAADSQQFFQEHVVHSRMHGPHEHGV